MKAEPITPAVDILAGCISQMEPIVRIQCYDSGGGVAGSCMPTAVTTCRNSMLQIKGLWAVCGKMLDSLKSA
jgi:hypothetical protein